MLYMPVPGTLLYQQMTEQAANAGRCRTGGHSRSVQVHAAISCDESKQFLGGAFRACFVSARHSSTDGSVTRITQRREFAHLPTRRTSFGQPITRRCGRWSDGAKGETKQFSWRYESAGCDVIWRLRFGLPTRVLRMMLGPIRTSCRHLWSVTTGWRSLLKAQSSGLSRHYAGSARQGRALRPASGCRWGLL